MEVDRRDQYKQGLGNRVDDRNKDQRRNLNRKRKDKLAHVRQYMKEEGDEEIRREKDTDQRLLDLHVQFCNTKHLKYLEQIIALDKNRKYLSQYGNYLDTLVDKLRENNDMQALRCLLFVTRRRNCNKEIFHLVSKTKCVQYVFSKLPGLMRQGQMLVVDQMFNLIANFCFEDAGIRDSLLNQGFELLVRLALSKYENPFSILGYVCRNIFIRTGQLGNTLPKITDVKHLWKDIVLHFMELTPKSDPESIAYFCDMFALVAITEEYARTIVGIDLLMQRFLDIYKSNKTNQETRNFIVDLFYNVAQFPKLHWVFDKYDVDRLTMVLLPKLRRQNNPQTVINVLIALVELASNDKTLPLVKSEPVLQSINVALNNHGTNASVVIRALKIFSQIIPKLTRSDYGEFLQAYPFILTRMSANFTCQMVREARVFMLKNFLHLIALDTSNKEGVVQILEEGGVRDVAEELFSYSTSSRANDDNAEIEFQHVEKLLDVFQYADDCMDISEE